jgi:hypothetical protein
MIELLLSLGLNKYDTSRILPVKCYIDNFVCLWSYIRNINIHQDEEEEFQDLTQGSMLVSEYVFPLGCGNHGRILGYHVR